jgi:hypothetical protein
MPEEDDNNQLLPENGKEDGEEDVEEDVEENDDEDDGINELEELSENERAQVLENTAGVCETVTKVRRSRSRKCMILIIG